jgi:hypothetical protein
MSEKPIEVDITFEHASGFKEFKRLPFELIADTGIIKYKGKLFHYVSGSNLWNHKFAESEVVEI